MKFSSILTIIILVITLLSCKKESTVVNVDAEAVPFPSYDKTYIGETHFVKKILDSSVMHNIIDTTYADTMLVSYKNDSVFFALSHSTYEHNSNPGYKIISDNAYLWDTSYNNTYISLDYKHEIIVPDSIISRTTWIQPLTAGHKEETYTFRGIK